MDEALREERAAASPGAEHAHGGRQAGALLADAYPGARDRERAVRWLGWAAYHWDTEPVAWWEIPARVPGRWLARARFTAAAVVAAAALGAASGFTLWVPVTILLVAVVALGSTGMRLPSVRPLRLPRPGTPRQVVPRWPRGRRAIMLAAVSLIPVVTFTPVLVQPVDRPGPRGRDRGHTALTAAPPLARFAAWLGSAGLVAAIVLGAGVPAGAWLGADLSLAAGPAFSPR